MADRAVLSRWRGWRALVLAGCWLFAAASWALTPVALGDSRLEFATVDEARQELTRDDDWIAATGDFQRASLLRVTTPVARDEFRSSLAAMARAWTDEEAAVWREAARMLAPQLERLGLRLPAQVRLVRIDGANPANSPHTRGDAIFLPARPLPPQIAPADVLAHELFHILSRRDPALADRVYALLGFQPVAELEWPASWESARLANPDAPRHRHAMSLEWNGSTARVMPVLVARHTDLGRGENIFQVMSVRLLVLAPEVPGQPSRAALRDGQPVWLPAYETPEYLRRLGGNSRYVIHPEETAADNFMFITSGRSVPNPALLRQIEATMRPAPPSESKP